MGEKTVKTVKVDPSKAEAWEGYVDENAYVDSTSHLIRLAVKNEMERGGDIQSTQSASTDSNATQSGEILTALRGIQTSIGDIEERLSALEDVKESESNYNLRKAIFSILPTPSESKGTGNGMDYHEWALTSEQIARKLGADQVDVIDALDEMRENTGQVRRVGGGPDNEAYYFKRGE